MKILALTLACGVLFAADPTHVPKANTKVANTPRPHVLSPEFYEYPVAQGSMPVENPADHVPYYGYNDNGPLLPAPGAVPAVDKPVIEASKTEPDKNAYLVLPRQSGPDANYYYGQHFLFQGHETGLNGHFTRVNLDALDADHRITLMATQDINKKALPIFDGITWYPWAQRFLLSAELSGTTGGLWQATLDYPSQVEDISGVVGRGGYEGIQADNQGNVIIVEDIGGTNGTKYPNAKRPNSFVYRFIPTNPYNLTSGGKLQVLQVMGRSGKPILFNSASVDDSIANPDMQDLHTYHLTFPTKWVTIHDTAVSGFTPFDAGALAKGSNGGTPFKRPENGQFRPGSDFTEFYFDETGDTDNRTQAGTQFGGYGSIFKLKLSPSSDDGTLQLLYLGDQEHTGLDNCTFFDENKIIFVEDAGDTLHTQRNALDSAYLFDVRVDYGSPNAPKPIRIIAEGRDPSATIDSALSGLAGFQNEGDNEITGIHISDGDPTIDGLLGASIPTPFTNGWRFFWTAQHGDNVTFEVKSKVRQNW